MPSCPKNYPFYNWVPKPLGILILLLLFITRVRDKFCSKERELV